MAVFLVNTCKFNSCGITFPTLTELIKHIEETHLDFDPRSIEEHELQQPSCLPISYILRVFTDNSRKDQPNSQSSGNPQPRKLMRSHSPALSLCSTTPTGSEMDEEDNESDSGQSSIDSWVNINVENDSANAILKIMSPQSCQTASNNSNCDEKDKPFVCMIGGCKKRYRNANGLKYHAKSAHNNNNNTPAQKKEIIGPSKVYKCHCGKIYKTSHGLKNHTNQHHNNNQQQAQTQTQKPTQTQIQTQTQSQTQTQTQTQTQVQTQTQPLTQTPVQPQSAIIMNKTPVIAGNSLPPTSKESILATFVRMKSLPSLPTASSGSGVQLNRVGLDGLPLMLTLQADNENKHDSDLANNDDKQGLNNDNGVRKCPVIAAPTLQQHLLSPIVGKSTISVAKIL